MKWSERQLQQHRRVARLLSRIKDETFLHISKTPGISEWQAHEFILNRYRKYGLTTTGGKTIVAFGENTRHIHYYPEKKKPRRLKSGDLVMIDVWARLRPARRDYGGQARLGKVQTPYADITWMGYRGSEIPPEVQKVFAVVRRARDAAVGFIKKELRQRKMPRGADVDRAARSVIEKSGYGEYFTHSTGHPLGTTSPHGRGVGISRRYRKPLKAGIGYTIEPGIYLPAKISTAAGVIGKFGVRSEIDFYIAENFRLVITTPVQKNVVRV